MLENNSPEAIRMELRMMEERTRQEIKDMVKDTGARLERDFRMELEKTRRELNYKMERMVSAAERDAASAKFNVEILTIVFVLTIWTFVILGLAFSHGK